MTYRFNNGPQDVLIIYFLELDIYKEEKIYHLRYAISHIRGGKVFV